MLTQVWYYHYIYSRRYGLQTTYAVVLNSVLIFVVLFYVYPLKFLFTLVVGGLSGGLTVPQEQLNRMFTAEHQIPALMVIYSMGYIAVCVIFALLYHYAYRMRADLQLNEYEALRTMHAAFFQLSFAAIGVVVIVLALLLPVRLAGYAGMFYAMNGVVGFALGSILGKRERRALERVKAESAAPAS
jgi:flagellar biosynthesis protein FlhB